MGSGLPLVSQLKAKGRLLSFLLRLDMTHVQHARDKTQVLFMPPQTCCGMTLLTSIVFIGLPFMCQKSCIFSYFGLQGEWMKKANRNTLLRLRTLLGQPFCVSSKKSCIVTNKALPACSPESTFSNICASHHSLLIRVACISSMWSWPEPHAHKSYKGPMEVGFERRSQTEI